MRRIFDCDPGVIVSGWVSLELSAAVAMGGGLDSDDLQLLPDDYFCELQKVEIFSDETTKVSLPEDSV